ncbi:MAG: LamG-like jellyroll fold domain-containing protein, partial [Planctomycetota bacterium]
KNIIAISSGRQHTLALEENGKVWHWGRWGVDLANRKYLNYKYLGGLFAPAEVTNWEYESYCLTDVSSISASGLSQSFAVDSEGQIWSWGCNCYGQLGLGFSGTCICYSILSGYPMNVPLPRPVPWGRVVNITQDTEYEKIQKAVEDAASGDEIVVYEGYHATYWTDGGNGLYFADKDLILRSSEPSNWDVVSNTVIDLTAESPITLGGNSVLSGFTIVNGGTGVRVSSGSSSKPIITNNIIKNCSNNGIECYEYSGPTIKNNLIVSNGHTQLPAGLGSDGIKLAGFSSSAKISNNIIANNTGYGIDYDGIDDWVTATNCIIVDNLQGQVEGYYLATDHCYMNDPSFVDYFDFWDITTQNAPDDVYNAIYVADVDGASTPYAEGDVIELKNDGIARIIDVGGIDAENNMITFYPNLDDYAEEDVAIYNWGPYYDFSDITTQDAPAGIYDAVYVADVDGTGTQYEIGDLIEYNKDGVHRIIEAIDPVDNTIIFYPPFVDDLPSATGMVVYNFGPDSPNLNLKEDYHLKLGSPCIDAGDNSLYPDPTPGDGVNQIDIDFDIDGEPRSMGSAVDIGADEYAPLKVEAGAKKQGKLPSPEVDLSIELSDASVLYNAFPYPPGVVTVQWSQFSGPPEGVVFGSSLSAIGTVVKDSVTFCKTGTYVLKLTAYDDGYVAGHDTVTVDVSVGVEAGDTQVTDMSSPTIQLAGSVVEFTCTDSGLEGWWPLEGNLLDSSGNNRDGTLSNPSFAAGGYKGQQVLDLTGVSECVEISGSSYTGVLGKNARTCSAWIKLAPGSIGDIFLWGEGVNNGDNWRVHVHNQVLRVAFGGGSIMGTATLDDNVWHHIAVVLPEVTTPQSADVLLYVDGQPDAPSQFNNVNINTVAGATPVIVKIGGNAVFFDGLLSDVRIYNRALGNNEIAGLADYLSTTWHTRGRDELVTFGDDSSPATSATFHEAGVYYLNLAAANQAGDEVGQDTVTVIVEDSALVNIFANDQITWPSNRVELVGQIEGVKPWSFDWYSDDTDKVTFDIPVADESMLASGAQFAGPGTYTLALAAKDKWGDVIGCDKHVVTVNPQAISVDAGDDITIPDTTIAVNLHGSASGNELNFAKWEFAGLEMTFGDPCDVDTWAVFTSNPPDAGDYEIALVGRDLSGEIIGLDTLTITVTGSGTYQQAVTVEALSSSYNITLPENVSLTADVSGDVTSITTRWFDSSGKVTFDVLGGGITMASFSEPGTYDIALLAEGPGGIVGTDVITIVVNDWDLAIQAGQEQEILMSYPLTLHGSVSGSGTGLIETAWQCSAESVSIENPELADGAIVTFSESGEFVLELVVTSWGEVIGSDTVVIKVRQPEAIVYIGPDQDITLPASGTLTVPFDAEVYGVELVEGEYQWISQFRYLWSCSGCTGVSFDPDDNEDTNVTFTQEGTYVLRLDVEKLEGLMGGYVPIGSDEVTITVLPLNTAPFVEAGTYDPQIVGVPLQFNSNETWYLDDGLPVSPEYTYTWTKINGPAVNFDTSVLHPVVMFNEPGAYTLQLEVSDGSILPAGFDTVTIEVYPSSQATTFSAGENDEVTISDDGVASVRLDGWVLSSAPDTITVQWYDAGATGNVIFGENNEDDDICKPVATFNADGTYALRMEVYEDGGSIGSDTITVTVYPAGTTDNTPPQITAFVATTSDGAPIDGRTDVCGEITVVVEAKDFGSAGMDKIELLLQEGVLPEVSLRLLDLPDISSGFTLRKLSINRIFSTYPLNDGNYTLIARAEDADGNDASEVVKTFTVVNPASSIKAPTAVITNLNNGWDSEESGIRMGELPVIKEGFYDLEGVAHHDQGSSFKIELFKAQAWSYVYQDWNKDAMPELYVKTLLDWTMGQIGTPGEPPTGASLGELDFTTVPNGSYQLLLTVQGTNGLFEYANAGFVLDCPLKIGNVKFTQEDLVIRVGGVPLRVARTYDSFQKDKDGDFGFGWAYSITGMDVELDEDRAMLRSDSILGSGENRMVRAGSDYARNVTLTLPNGNRATFMFYMELEMDIWDSEGPCYVAKYMSPPGVGATLETWRGSDYDHAEKKQIFGPWVEQYKMNGFLNAANYDFYGYKLTTEDGAKYYFERENYFNENAGDIYDYEGLPYVASPRGELYLSMIVTANGETIDFNVDESTLQVGQAVGSSGIEHKDKDGVVTKAIKIVYDNDGRISEIYAPSELAGTDPATIKYVYEDAGAGKNLTEVHKLVDKTAPAGEQYEITRYVYEDLYAQPPVKAEDHYICKIVDPRGLSPVQYLYDDDGRLVGTKDAHGNVMAIQHGDGVNFPNDNVEVVFDRLNNRTVYFYNERGNVVRVLDALNNETTYSYDETSDHPDDVESVTVSLPGGEQAVTAHSYQYDDGLIDSHRVEDPENNVTKTSYDDIGNVTKVSQWRLTDTPPAEPEYPTDYDEVARTTNKYYWRDSSGLNTTGAGTPTNYLYSTDVVVEFDALGDPQKTERTEYEYDTNNRLWKVKKIDPDGVL